mmetsp:Transcript_94510/g.141617  ORF Transcript_94510/g.141617 Transcript_94510/m.141617 type:complete len:100 (+) Transcript_94510:644-943(+)
MIGCADAIRFENLHLYLIQIDALVDFVLNQNRWQIAVSQSIFRCRHRRGRINPLDVPLVSAKGLVAIVTQNVVQLCDFNVVNKRTVASNCDQSKRRWSR